VQFIYILQTRHAFFSKFVGAFSIVIVRIYVSNYTFLIYVHMHLLSFSLICEYNSIAESTRI